MKKNALISLALTTALMILVLPVSAAKNVEFRANGKVASYFNYDPDDPDLGAMVVGGNWNINVKNFNPDDHLGDVDFKLFYRELNLGPGENAPAGTVDHFRITLVELVYVNLIPGEGCYVYGYFNVDKLAWLPEGSTPRIEHIDNFLGTQEGWVRILPDGLELWAGAWHLIGSTTSMTMK